MAVRGQNAVLTIGVLMCLIGAFLMFHGNILGERTTGIATVVGNIGIGIISTSKTPALVMKRKEGM
jgi:hypothetical protein